LLNVDTNFTKSEIEVFMSLKLKTKIGSKRLKIGIGFEIYEYQKGKKMEGRYFSDRATIAETGYTVSNN
jgi:hypothetical protein